MELCKGFVSSETDIVVVANETRAFALFDFFFWAGGGGGNFR